MNKIFLALLLAAPAAQAQVEYLMDMLTSQICLANNWGTPSLKKQFARLNAAQYAALRQELEMQFGAAGFACLMEKRLLPEAACELVIHDMIHQQNPPVGGGNPFLSKESEAQISDVQLEEAMRQCLMPADEAAAR